MRHETFPLSGPRGNTPKLVATELFSELRAIGDDGIGITREAFAVGENAAFDMVRRFAASHGLATDVDPAGNLVVYGATDDRTRPAYYIGSHLDSVPQGGNFDGAAGVVAGLMLLADPLDGAPPIRVIALRGEESAFYGRANTGARALFGELTAKDLAAPRLGSGGSLADAMTSCGIDLGPIAAGRVLFDISQALGYLELHIEQGPVLVAADEPVGIVPGIRGNVRYRQVACHGEPGHSGAVPRDLRRDAVFAFADLVTRLDRRWEDMLRVGDDVVFTCGIVGTDPHEHAMTRIPADLYFSAEIRSQSQTTLELADKGLREDCAVVARERGVSFTLDTRIDTAPAVLDPKMTSDLVATCQRLGLPGRLVPSGAGHDAAVFANAGVPSAMIFIRNENGSHNPREAMRLDDFLEGVRVMRSQLEAWR